MALVFLVRHAQASFGTADYDRLSDRGHEQSRWLGEYFLERGVRFARVTTGTLKRQRDTAAGMLSVLGMDPTQMRTDAGLNEYQGDRIWAAHTGGADPVARQKADYRGYWQTFREGMVAWSENRLSNVPETWDEFGARMMAAMTQATHGLGRDDTALVVSSGGAIGRLLGALTGATATSAIEFNLQFRNTGFCELIAHNGRLRLTSFNNIPHLERADRRGAITFA
jgi:broad specificity phosphatase PhoE